MFCRGDVSTRADFPRNKSTRADLEDLYSKKFFPGSFSIFPTILVSTIAVTYPGVRNNIPVRSLFVVALVSHINNGQFVPPSLSTILNAAPLVPLPFFFSHQRTNFQYLRIFTVSSRTITPHPLQSARD